MSVRFDGRYRRRVAVGTEEYDTAPVRLETGIFHEGTPPEDAFALYHGE